MARPYAIEKAVKREEQGMKFPERAKDVKPVPDFFTYMEEEFDGDYSAARSAYINEYGVDPTMMALR